MSRPIRCIRILMPVLLLCFIQPLASYAQPSYKITLDEGVNEDRLFSPVLLSSLNTAIPVLAGYIMVSNDILNDTRSPGIGLMLYGFGVGPGTGFLITERPK